MKGQIMLNALSQQAREVIAIANQESRRFGHAYVGTEHILLALMRDPAFTRSGMPARLGLSADAVRAEVEAWVPREPMQREAARTSGEGFKPLPLTPRAQRAIRIASDEAASVSLPLAGPEHLLLGLIKDPDGVAGRVLRKLGLDAGRICAESHRLRLRQMQTIERVVRPLHAGVKRKRRMREELLAHLTAICEEEQQGVAVDELAALDAAVRRFGDPAELARDLQRSLPRSERFDYLFERWLGWRAPETVLRMLLRTSLISFALLALVAGIPVVCALLFSASGAAQGWDLLRLFVEIAVVTPVAQFTFGWCYYKARDSLWGAFGTQRSAVKAGLWSLGAAVAIFACAMGFILAVHEPAAPLGEAILVSTIAGAAAAITCGVVARGLGRGALTEPPRGGVVLKLHI
jgi:hypothetical protein